MYLYAYIMEIENLAVTVNIPGIGDVTAMNAAQDSTLNAILGAIQAQSKSGGGGSASGGGFAAANQKAKSAASGLGALGGAASSTGDAFSSAGQSASNAANSFKSASKTVFSSFGALASQNTTTSGMIGELGQSMQKALRIIPFTIGTSLAAVVGVITGALTGNIESYEKMQAAGGSFGFSLTQFQDISHDAGLTLGQMTAIVQKSGEALSMFGGTTAQGARDFAKHNQKIQDSVGGQLLRMGIGFQEQGQYLAEFMGDLVRGGEDIRNLDTATLQKSFMDLTSQQKVMAQYNGVTLEQQRQESKAKKEDAQLQASFMKLSAKSRIAATEVASNLAKTIPGFDKVFKEMALDIAQGGSGDAFTAASVALTSQFPELAAKLKSMAQGFANGETEFTDNLKQAFGTITQGQLSSAASLAIAQGFGANGPVVEAITGALLGAEIQMRKARGEVLAMGQDDMSQVREGKGMSKLDKNVNQLADTMQEFKKKMDEINSGLLNSSLVGAGLTSLEEVINNTQKYLDDAIKTATNQMNNTSSPAQQTVDAGVAVTEALFDTIFDKLKDLIDYLNPLSSSSSASPASPMTPSRTSASQAAATLPTVPQPDVAIAQGLGANVPDELLQLAKLSGEGVIPDDVADAMRSTPMLIQELTAQVRRSSEDNARIVQQAIMHA